MSNLEKYNRIFTEIFGVNETELNDSFTYKDKEQWDSVAHLSMITELEDTFDVMLNAEDILHFGSYSNGKKILSGYGIEI